MNIWVLIVLLGVVAMVVGPVMMLQPNSTQRRQMALRQRALELELRVGMGALPRRATDSKDPVPMPIYCLPRSSSEPLGEPWLLVRTAYAHERHFMENWAWNGTGRPDDDVRARLERILPRLPQSVQGISADPQGWCCYWSERGGVVELERLAHELTELAGG